MGPSQARDHTALRVRILELAHARPRFGYLQTWVLLRCEGWQIEARALRRNKRAFAGRPIDRRAWS